MREQFLNKLGSWFGNAPHQVLQEDLREVDGDPVMFVTARTNREMMMLRVRKQGGRIKVSTDSTCPCERVPLA